jgi:hypothetical protein
MDAAHELGAHLLCLAGGVLGAPTGESGERNGIFDLARQIAAGGDAPKFVAQRLVFSEPLAQTLAAEP